MNILLPRANAAITDGRGFSTVEFRRFLQSLASLTDEATLQAEIDALILRVQVLEDAGLTDAQVFGILSIKSSGTLAEGSVAFSLLGDEQDPGNTYYYGTGPDGEKTFYTVASAFTATEAGIELVTGADGVTDIRPDDDLEALEALATTGFSARTAANTWALRTFQFGAGLTGSNLDGVLGDPSYAHADTSSVANLTSDNSGTVVIQDLSITFDTFGHVLTATVGTVDVAASLAGTYQPLDATLTALAGQNWAANALPIGSGADTVAQVLFAANTFPARASAGNLVAKPITDFALTLLDDADTTEARATLDVVVDSIIDGDTTRAPSRNAVFDALAGKEPTITAGTAAQFWRGDKTFGNTLTGDIGSGGAFLGDSGQFNGTHGGLWAQKSGGAARFQALSAGVQSQFFGARCEGTLASPTATASGASVFDLYASTYTGSAWTYCGLVSIVTTETHSATAQGTAIRFLTTKNGTTWTNIRSVLVISNMANVLINTSNEQHAGEGCLGIGNALAVPSANPVGGAVIYAESSAAKCRGGSGTVTTFGPAEPHCPVCGRDHVLEAENEAIGWYQAICLHCFMDRLTDMGLDTKPGETTRKFYTRVKGEWADDRERPDEPKITRR